MPYRAPKHCARPETAALHVAPLHDDRASAWERGYDSTWQRLRIMHLRRNSLCALCGEPAIDVHHVVALRNAGARLDGANLQSLCHSCHSKITGKEKRACKN